MNARAICGLKGLLTAVAAMAIYAVPLGFFLALTLLVASMEEGADSVSAMTVPLTQTVVLLSQGVGFHTDSFALTITPLLLTALLITLIVSLSRRLSTDHDAYVVGVLAWSLINWLFARGVEVSLNDSAWLVVLKAALVYTAGFAIAALPHSGPVRSVMTFLRLSTSVRLRRALFLGIMVGLGIEALYMLCGMVAFLTWIVLNHQAMGAVFDLSGMGIGSRILTTVCMLAWVPNICVWATSWVFGGGFAIGDLASFSLWSGQGRSLPPIPAFALFPQAMGNNTARLVLLAAPMAACALIGLLALWWRHGFAIRAPRVPFPDRSEDGDGSAVPVMPWKRLIVDAAHPVGAFCLSGAIVAVLSSVAFALSNGSLGTRHLAHVGVEVIDSTRVLGRPAIAGLLASWLLSTLVLCCVMATRWMFRRRRGDSCVGGAPTGIGRLLRSLTPRRVRGVEHHGGVDADGTTTPRVTKSTRNSKEDPAT